MKHLSLLLMVLNSGIAFSGGSFGGNPPYVANEILMVNLEDVKAIALSAIENPNQEINVNGKIAQPKLIDLDAKVMRFETKDAVIIDVSQVQ